VHPAAQDRVAHVIEVRRMGPGEQDGALHLGVRADDRAIADPGAPPDVGARPDLDVPADKDRTLDHRRGVDAGAAADGDPVAGQVDLGEGTDLDRVRGEGGEDLRERLPQERPGGLGVEAAGEDGRELGEERWERGGPGADDRFYGHVGGGLYTEVVSRRLGLGKRGATGVPWAGLVP